jgi:hypothetical protein
MSGWVVVSGCGFDVVLQDKNTTDTASRFRGWFSGADELTVSLF